MSINVVGTAAPINIEAMPQTASIPITPATHQVIANSFVDTDVNATLATIPVASINASAQNSINITASLGSVSISGFDAAVIGDPETINTDVTASTAVVPVFALNPNVSSDHESILSEIEGFASAAGVTGGQGGPVVTVTNLNSSGSGSLQQAINDASGATWIRFSEGLSGIINLSSLSVNKSDITIDGRGADVQLERNSGGGRVVDFTGNNGNIIFMYMKVDGGNGFNTDGIRIRETIDGIWLHHITVQNCEDECIDVWNSTSPNNSGIANLTLSWSNLIAQTTTGVMLINGSDGLNGVMSQVTLHHNFFDGNGTGQRLPRVRHAFVHEYNNYLFDWTSTCINVSYSGEVYFENNVCTSTGANNVGTELIEDGSFKGFFYPTGGDLFINGAHHGTISEQNEVFNPSTYYSHTAEPATTTLRDTIIADAGWQDVPFPGDEPPHEAIISEQFGFSTLHGTSGVTGGAGLANVVTVTNLNNSGSGSLRQALADNPGGSWIRFSDGLSGTINLSSDLSPPSNTTIDGRGANITLNRSDTSPGANCLQYRNNDTSNFIVMYLKFTGASDQIVCGRYDGTSQLIRFDGFWFHHNTHTGPAGDELIDFSPQCDNITVSYCKLENNTRGILIESVQPPYSQARTAGVPPCHFTQHHCWYTGISWRHPMHRQTICHTYNDLHEDWGTGIISAQEGIASEVSTVVENTIGDAAGAGSNNLAQSINNTDGISFAVPVKALGTNWLRNGANIAERDPGNAFDPSSFYSYTAVPADAALESDIRANAGWQNVPFPE